MPPTTDRKDLETTKKLREVMGGYFADLGRGAAERQEDGLVHERRPGRVALVAGLQRLLSREPRRHARRRADGHRLDPPGQRPRVLARHLLLSDQRCGRVRERRKPVAEDEALGPAEGRRLGLQHQPVSRRQGLVSVLRAGVERAVPGSPHPPGDQHDRSAAGRLCGPSDRSPGRSVGSGGWPEARHGSPAPGDRHFEADHDACGRPCSKRPLTCPRRSHSSTGRCRWARPSSCAAWTERPTITKRCWPS